MQMRHEEHSSGDQSKVLDRWSGANFGSAFRFPPSYNKESFAAVEAAEHWPGLLRPLHSSFCTANTMGLLLNALGCDHNLTSLPESVLPKDRTNFSKVVLILADGFGWNLYEKFRNEVGLLKDLEREGRISKITAQYPSATPTQLASLATGKPACCNRVFDRAYFEPQVDEFILPLNYKFVGDEDSMRLLDCAHHSKLFSTETVFSRLRAEGTASHVYLRGKKGDPPSPFNSCFYKDAGVHSFSSASEAVQALVKTLSEEDAGERSLHYLHYLPIDRAAHDYGPDSKEVRDVVAEFFSKVEGGFRVSGSETRDTLLVVTADHGQTLLVPENEIQLFPLLEELRTIEGASIRSAGSMRNLFLYVNPKLEEDVRNRLRDFIGNRGEVELTRELVSKQFFGAVPASQDFLERVGNVVILLRSGFSMNRDKHNTDARTWMALHGGLSKEEMEVPFITRCI